MAAEGAWDNRKVGNRGINPGFEWVSSSPSPSKVAELEGRFPEVVQISTEVLEASSACWKDNAVLARTYHRWVPPEAFVREFRRAGIAGDIHSVCLAHHCYVFRFEASDAQDLVIGRPWVVNGQPVATERWRPDFVPASDSLSSILLWVRVPALPMEYWDESVLAAILEPAGEFIVADSATRAVSRGAFARACVRIDLRRPLRPGVRLQGSASPFWQSFQFEHLTGICAECGSIHLLGPCSSSAQPPSPATASLGPLFGPWMSATRQRKPLAPVRVQLSQETGSPSVAADQPSPAASGPGSSSSGRPSSGKLVRRRPVQAGKGRIREAVLKTNDPLILVDPSMAASVNGGVKAGGLCAALKLQVRPEALSSDTPDLTLKNPFGLLDKVNDECSIVTRPDANPGPSKRARPEDSLSRRSNPKSGNQKGKGTSPKAKDSKKKISSLNDLMLSHDIMVVNW